MLKYFKMPKKGESLRDHIVHVDHERSHNQHVDMMVKKSPSTTQLYQGGQQPGLRDSFQSHETYHYEARSVTVPNTPAFPQHPDFESRGHLPSQGYPQGSQPLSPMVPNDSFVTQDSFDDASSYHSLQSDMDLLRRPSDPNRRSTAYRAYSAPSQPNPQHPNFSPQPSPHILRVERQLNQSMGPREPLGSHQAGQPPSVEVSAGVNPAPARARTSELLTAVAPLTETLNQSTSQPGAEPSAAGEEFLKKAIHFHEKGELEKATVYFRKAAEHHNPLGMFLFGMSLRHGWGCKVNPNLAFQFLQKAAENAVFDLQNLNPVISSAARSELALAIYELGVSFRHGWGVPKNKETAAYYFEIAANLGDADAQADLAFCYQHAAGVKKDMAKAAKYYRMAHAQGVQIFGNSWIFKSKYDSTE
ncbi:hypothetical protein IWQ61_009356 [Dispira simplex]|nr:hypothetical protein IWQ61_009356 [Dispira simplex]